MKYPFLVPIAVLTAVLSVEAQAQKAPTPAPAVRTAAASRVGTTPKTPWGDPDIQGTWTSDDCIGTPMNRAANLGEKRYYTEQELAQREGQLARQAQADFQEFAPQDARIGTGPPSHWAERARRPCKQTSLVVD